MQLLQTDTQDWSQGGDLVADAKSLLSSFAQWSATHVKRESNQTAHTLAKEATLYNLNLFDLEHFPICIIQCVI